VVLVVALASSTLVTGTAKGAPEKVDSCPVLVLKSAIVTKDLTCTGTDGIRVGADNITIDLGGHMLTGNGAGGTMGIDNDTFGGFDNVTVRNGVLRNFFRGISSDDPTASMTVEDVVVVGSFTIGVYTEGKAKLTSVVASGNGSLGIAVGDDSVISSTIASHNTNDGISACGSKITSTTASNNGIRGIHASCAGSTLRHVTATGNGSHGIEAGSQALIDSSTASGNTEDGIHMGGASGTILDSFASGNGGDGIDVYVLGNNTKIKGVTASGNVDRGIAVVGNNVQITDSVASGNQLAAAAIEAAIFVDGDPVTITGNRAESNGFVGGASDDIGYGIGVNGFTAVPQGDNIGRGNDSPGECVPETLC
jgi:hypothetical protein